MVLARLLTDSGALGTEYGRVMIGITLVEDIAVVFMTIIIPIFSGPSEGRFQKAAWTLGKATLLLIPLVFLAMTVVPRVLRKAARTKDHELFLLVAIAICLVSAAVAQAVGFSVALGAFLAGLSISGSEDLHEAHTTLIPLRDAFVALFFVSLGTLVVPSVIIHNLPLLGVMLLLIVVGKFVVWLGVMKLFRYSLWTSIAVAAGLTQIGELSFILVEVAKKSGLVGEEVFTATLAASLISIFLNMLLVRWVMRRITPKLAPKPPQTQPPKPLRSTASFHAAANSRRTTTYVVIPSGARDLLFAFFVLGTTRGNDSNQASEALPPQESP